MKNVPDQHLLDQALLKATRNNEAAAVRALISVGANPEAVDDLGETAICIAARCADVECVAMLLDGGADINRRLPGGRLDGRRAHATYSLPATALNSAIQMLDFDKAEFLLDRGADPRQTDSAGRTALQTLINAACPRSANEALHVHARRLISRMVKHGADLDEAAPGTSTPLALALDGDAPAATIDLLLDLGADPEVVTGGIALIHRPWRKARLKEMRALVRAGADINMRDHAGAPPVFYAEHVNVLDAIVELGGDVHARDSQGRNALLNYFCKVMGSSTIDAQVVHALLDYGVDPEAKDMAGMSAASSVLNVDRTLAANALHQALRSYKRDAVRHSLARRVRSVVDTAPTRRSLRA
jgi:ankyrin repeat protein